jgi:hypothetical protein
MTSVQVNILVWTDNVCQFARLKAAAQMLNVLESTTALVATVCLAIKAIPEIFVWNLNAEVTRNAHLTRLASTTNVKTLARKQLDVTSTRSVLCIIMKQNALAHLAMSATSKRVASCKTQSATTMETASLKQLASVVNAWTLAMLHSLVESTRFAEF